ncbi:hypothetical protein FALBO_12779 [Fusarium albosuccineum]|uniref:NAD-dependent epimerase/dehydratase domain-containing protein n=1 Tax=Fusarium albosuccineum TaxID=1237068 RepID=A0A8H4P5Z6_9HYPO|nr:hypothetical protein FALBO_12779 [Fusarium albosuccineum]
MDSVECAVFHNGRAAKSRRGLLLSRDKHRGISFVNATVATTKRRAQGSQPVSGVKVVSAKIPTAHESPKTMTEEDLKRAQQGKNKRLAPRIESNGKGMQKSPKHSCSVPYQTVADFAPAGPFLFSFEIIEAWYKGNEEENRSRLSPPTSSALPDWTLHGLPVEISDEGRRCFHAYLFSCPIRHYPFEQLHIVSWQPLAWDQTRFERLMLEPLALRCTLTMGALFLLLKSGKREGAGFAMHSARLCALVNKLLDDKHQNWDKSVVLIQSVASLALLATFLGLYDHWYAHVKGLKLLISAVGGAEALPAPVQLLVKKADLKGASEIVTMPLMEFAQPQQPISHSLPCDQQISIATDVRRALCYQGKENEACGTIISLAIYVATIDFAASRCVELVFDPLVLMEEYHYLEHRLLATPWPIQTHEEALQEYLIPSPVPKDPASSPHIPLLDPELESKKSLQIVLRLAALFYLKLIKGGPPDNLDGQVHILRLLLEHMHCISHISARATSVIYGMGRSLRRRSSGILGPAQFHPVYSSEDLILGENISSNTMATSKDNRAVRQGSLVLVTGANGFLGSHTVDQFLEYGYRVKGTVRNIEKNGWLVKFFNNKYGSGRFELVEVPDMTVETAFDEVIKGVTIFAHIASDTSLDPDPNNVIPPKISNARNALKAAYGEPEVKRFVYTSSSAALYPVLDGPGLVVGQDTWNKSAIKEAWKEPPYEPERGMAVYSASKTQAEQEIWRFHQEHRHRRPDLVVNTVLPSVNRGKPLDLINQGYPSTSEFIPLLCQGKTFPMHPFFPRQYYVHVQDTARLHVAAGILADPSKVYPENFSGGIDLNEVPRDEAEKMLRALGRPGWVGLKESVGDSVTDL